MTGAPAPSPSLRQLAQALGLSRSTVSRALNNAPRISAATRRAVQEEARRMGYRPSAALSAAMSGAASRGRRQFRETVAIVSFDYPLHLHKPDLSHAAWRRVFCEGLVESAGRLGCDLDFLSLRDHPLPSLRRILRARGISRAIILRFPAFSPADDRMAEMRREINCVFVGSRQCAAPDGVTVAPDLFSAGQTAFLAAWRAGYRRFYLTANIATLNPGRRFEAGVHFASLLVSSQTGYANAPLDARGSDLAGELERLDGECCVIGGVTHGQIPKVLKRLAGRDPPGWIDWHANLSQSLHPFTGIDQRDGLQASTALELCLGAFRALRSTEVTQAGQYLVPTGWIAGQTLPTRRSDHLSLAPDRPFAKAVGEQFLPLGLPGLGGLNLADPQIVPYFGMIPAPMIPPGRWIFHGLPFQLGGTPNGVGSSFLMAGAARGPASIAQPARRLAVRGRARAIYFLHLAAWAREHERIARYRIRYRDGQTVDVPVVALGSRGQVDSNQPPANIQDWWGANRHFHTDSARSVCLIDCDHHLGSTGYYYILHWANPRPTQPISSIDMLSEPGTEALLLLFAITLGGPRRG